MDKRRLDLKFRPDDVFSKPIYGELKPASGMFVKITHKRRKSGCIRLNNSDQNDTEPTIEVLGIVKQMFKFEGCFESIMTKLTKFSYFTLIFDIILGICDYQYLPIATHLEIKSNEFIYEEIMPSSFLSPDWLTLVNYLKK